MVMYVTRESRYDSTNCDQTPKHRVVRGHRLCEILDTLSQYIYKYGEEILLKTYQTLFLHQLEFMTYTVESGEKCCDGTNKQH